MKKEQLLTKSGIIIFLAMVSCFLWGSAFPVIKIGYSIFEIGQFDTATQILFAGIRFFLAGVFTILFGSIVNRKMLIPKKRSLHKIVKLGMMQTVVQYVFFYIGLAHTTGVKASILDGTTAFFAIIIASLVFRQEKISTQKVLGCLLGFAGVICINLNGSGIDNHFSFIGDGFIVLSSVGYAFSTVLVREYSKEDSPVLLCGYQFLFGGTVMIISGILVGGHLGAMSGKGLCLILYLGVLSAIAYTIWGILLKYNPVSRVAIMGFMTQIFGVVLSALWLGEKDQAFQIQSFIALLFVCAGIFIVNKQSSNVNN